MFKKPLVAVDFSPSTEALLSCLPDLRHWGAELLVLAHVIRIGYGQGSGYGNEASYLERLSLYAEPIRASGLDVELHVTASSAVAKELVDLAKRAECDFLVLGSRSHNFLYDVFLGSVTKEVIRLSELPVLIERLEPIQSGKAETCSAICRQALEKILLATDHSAQSHAAHKVALHLARQGGKIDCITVLESEPSEADVKSAQVMQNALMGALEMAGAQSRAIIERGDSAEAVLRTSTSGYSLILIGKHGQNWLASKVIGSTTAAICEGARLPVLMVPSPHN